MKYYNCVRGKSYSNTFAVKSFVLKPPIFSCVDTGTVAYTINYFQW